VQRSGQPGQAAANHQQRGIRAHGWLLIRHWLSPP
jgi:hypothetical protein